MNSSDITGKSATSDVDTERINTWLSDLFTISPYVMRPVAVSERWFSMILSYTTTVSYNEKPRMVKNAVTVAGVTANWNSAYMPAVKMMSWSTATIADAAIFHSKRIVRYAASNKKKMSSALSAF